MLHQSTKDFTGIRYGMLTALRPTDRRQGGSVIWQWQCDCGNIVERSPRNVRWVFKAHGSTDCGCATRNGKPPLEDYSYVFGKQFDKLTAGNEMLIREGCTVVECLCECGNTCYARPYDLAHGTRTSCSNTCKRYRPHLPYGVSSLHCIYSLYKLYAGRRGIAWDLNESDFHELTQRPCDECGKLPAISWISHKIWGRNGPYIHNKITYIDQDLGFTYNNIQTLCLQCLFLLRGERIRQARWGL